MLHNSPLNIKACIDVTSEARLSSYCYFFKISEADAYSIYKWNNELSSRLMHLIGVVEIILRNRIHAALVSELSAVFPHGQNHCDRWYKYVNKEQETERKLNSELLHKKTRTPLNPQPSANQIISKMSFGFWPNILKSSNKFEINNKATNIDWDKTFRKIFPGLSASSLGYWRNFSHRDPVIARCFSVNDLRNRVAHFEPVWKFGKDPSEVVPRNGVPKTYSDKPKDISEMINRLHRDFNRVTELLYWLSPEIYSDYQSSENHREISWLISKDAINSFLSYNNGNTITLNSIDNDKTSNNEFEIKAGCSALSIDQKKIGVMFIYP